MIQAILIRRDTPSLLLLTLAALVVSTTTTFAGEPIRVLIVDGQNNHAWQKTTPVLRAILESRERFAVDIATAPGGKDLTQFRPDFARYDVVLSNYNGHPWPAATRGDFVDFVRGGGGVVIVHAANNAFPRWPEYNQMIGVGGWGGRNQESGPYLRLRDGDFAPIEKPGRGGSHGRQHAFLIQAREPEHPILAGLPRTWLHARDELYDRLRGPAENLTVLASAFSSKETGGSGEHEPILMAIRFGKGRIFHTTLGHSPHAMRCVGFQVTLARGTEWAAKGEVTRRSLPPDFPTEDLVAVRDPGAPYANGWKPIFDGKTLDGWERKNGHATFQVEEGAIVGKTSEGSPNSFLCTEKHYGDFELRFEVKVDDALNSGVQIRSHSVPGYRKGRVHGYQVEIATNGTAGYIYDEARRGWLSKDRSDPDARAAFEKGQWNRYRVRCQGPSIRTWVNGVPVADLKDSMTARGFIGLQVHGIREGSGPYEVRWRNLYLRELEPGAGKDPDSTQEER